MGQMLAGAGKMPVMVFATVLCASMAMMPWLHMSSHKLYARDFALLLDVATDCFYGILFPALTLGFTLSEIYPASEMERKLWAARARGIRFGSEMAVVEDGWRVRLSFSLSLSIYPSIYLSTWHLFNPPPPPHPPPHLQLFTQSLPLVSLALHLNDLLELGQDAREGGKKTFIIRSRLSLGRQGEERNRSDEGGSEGGGDGDRSSGLDWSFGSFKLSHASFNLSRAFKTSSGSDKDKSAVATTDGDDMMFTTGSAKEIEMVAPHESTSFPRFELTDARRNRRVGRTRWVCKGCSKMPKAVATDASTQQCPRGRQDELS